MTSQRRAKGPIVTTTHLEKPVEVIWKPPNLSAWVVRGSKVLGKRTTASVIPRARVGFCIAPAPNEASLWDQGRLRSVITTNGRVSRRAGMFCRLWVVAPQLVALVLVVPAPGRKLPKFWLEGQASGSVWVYRPAWRAWKCPPLLPLSTVLSRKPKA